MILVSPEHIASYTQAGWWSEQTIGELFLQTAARQPEAPAVIDAPNRPQISGDAPLSWRWQDVLTQTGRLVALFAAQGLRKDDVVVMQLPNCAEMHAIYLACALTGVVVSPVPVQYREHELEHILALTAPRVGFTVSFGMSDNAVKPVDNRLAAHLGFRPQDNSEPFRTAVEAKTPPPDPKAPAVQHLGGWFVDLGHPDDGAAK